MSQHVFRSFREKKPIIHTKKKVHDDLRLSKLSRLFCKRHLLVRDASHRHEPSVVALPLAGSAFYGRRVCGNLSDCTGERQRPRSHVDLHPRYYRYAAFTLQCAPSTFLTAAQCVLVYLLGIVFRGALTTSCRHGCTRAFSDFGVCVFLSPA